MAEVRRRPGRFPLRQRSSVSEVPGGAKLRWGRSQRMTPRFAFGAGFQSVPMRVRTRRTLHNLGFVVESLRPHEGLGEAWVLSQRLMLPGS
jgi:hypothetical protein